MNRREWEQKKVEDLAAAKKRLEKFEAGHDIEAMKLALKIIGRWNVLKGKANPKNVPELPKDHIQCHAALCTECKHNDKPLYDHRRLCQQCHDGDNPERCSEIIHRDDLESEGWTKDEYTCGHTNDQTRYFCPAHSDYTTTNDHKCGWCLQDL